MTEMEKQKTQKEENPVFVKLDVFLYGIAAEAARDHEFHAALRHSFGKELALGRMDAWSVFYRIADKAGIWPAVRDDAFFAAGLVCWYEGSELGRAKSVSSALKSLPQEARATAAHRIQQLLYIRDHRILYGKLIALIRFLKKYGISVSPKSLLHDLVYWNYPSHPVQKSWLRNLRY